MSSPINRMSPEGSKPARRWKGFIDALTASLPLDDFLVCYHEDRDECSCRKPKPGLLLEAAARHGIELKDSYLIGDRWRDVDAGRRGMPTIWIDCGYREKALSNPSATVRSLKEAGDWNLARASASPRRPVPDGPCQT